MDPFCYKDLDYEEKLSLGDMVRHPGFTVLKKLLDDAFNQTVSRLTNLQSDDEKYDSKLKAYQMEMHICKEVCVTLVKSIEMHSQAGRLEQSVKQVQKQAQESEPEVIVLGEKFGSVSIKPRKNVTA